MFIVMAIVQASISKNKTKKRVNWSKVQENWEYKQWQRMKN